MPYISCPANIRCFSVMGGLLMVCVGVLYLVFEDSLLSTPGNRGKPSSRNNGLSRAILGLQIGLIVLATIVTRSSVASLQAKHGLPKGNQVMGWTILGQYVLEHEFNRLIYTQLHLFPLRSCIACSQTSTISIALSSFSFPSRRYSSSSRFPTKAYSTSYSVYAS